MLKGQKGFTLIELAIVLVVYIFSPKKISTATKKYKNISKNAILYEILYKYIYLLLDILA